MTSMWTASSDLDYYDACNPAQEEIDDIDLATEDLETPATLEEMLAIPEPIHCARCGCDSETVRRDREYLDLEDSVCCEAA